LTLTDKFCKYTGAHYPKQGSVLAPLRSLAKFPECWSQDFTSSCARGGAEAAFRPGEVLWQPPLLPSQHWPRI